MIQIRKYESEQLPSLVPEAKKRTTFNEKYEILKLIDQGATARVYLARDL